MPSTKIKKEKGEDFAIDYLFNLLNSHSWEDYDKYSILKKMKGYYIRANSDNKAKIKSEITNFVNQPNCTQKTDCFILLSNIYTIDKDFENAFIMGSGAIANINPNLNLHTTKFEECFNIQASILSNKDLTNLSNAANYLYYYLSKKLYTMAWYIEYTDAIGKKDERIDIWKTNIGDTKFPFEGVKPAMTALSTLTNGNINLEQNSTKFINLLFVDFSNAFSQNKSPIIIDEMVNNYVLEISKQQTVNSQINHN